MENTNNINAKANANANAKANNSSSSNSSSKKQIANDDMEKAVAKAERLAKIEANKAKRLENATKRFEALKQVKTTAVGFANVTIANVHTANANNANVQGAINSLNTFIKQVANINGLDKKIVATLKGEATNTLLQQVNETTLPLYIDNKGNYKTETLYRLVASKAKNSELRTLLNNINKASK